MDQLTNTERVAVALFGWEAAKHPFPGYEHDPCRWYHRGSYGEGQVGYNRGGQWLAIHTTSGKIAWTRHVGDDTWPDFTDERLAPYWCARMQREFAAKGLMNKYVCVLQREPMLKDDDVTYHLILATPTQRLEAAVRVLDEVGL